MHQVQPAEKLYPPRPDVPHAEHADLVAQLARCRDLLMQARDWMALLGPEQGCVNLVAHIDAHFRRGA